MKDLTDAKKQIQDVLDDKADSFVLDDTGEDYSGTKEGSEKAHGSNKKEA